MGRGQKKITNYYRPKANSNRQKFLDLVRGARRAYQGYQRARQVYQHVKSGYRKVQAYTSSAQKTKTAPSVGGHNDQRSSKFKLIVAKRYLKNAAQSKLVLTETWQTVQTGIEGRQMAFTCRAYCTSSSFVSTTLARNDQISQNPRYFDLDANQFSTGQTTGPLSAAIVTSLDRRLNVHSCWTDMNMTNLENTSCTAYVYFFMCKRDTEYSPLDLWITDCNNLDYSVPINWPTLTTDSNWSATGTSPQTLGTYPTTPNIKKHYKLMKVRKLELDGGSSHRLKFPILYNRSVLYSDMNNAHNAGIRFIKNLSIVPVVIVQGSPVGISDTPGATTSTEMTTSAPKIGITISRTLKFSPPKEGPQVPVKFNMPGLVSRVGTHVYGPKIIDDNDALADVLKA